MAIPHTTPSSLDFETLKKRINEEESEVHDRLISLIGKEENNTTFNVHEYEPVVSQTLPPPFSTLFIIKDGGRAEDDPDVKAWLGKEENKNQKVKCQDMVYISGLKTKIAVVR